MECSEVSYEGGIKQSSKVAGFKFQLRSGSRMDGRTGIAKHSTRAD